MLVRRGNTERLAHDPTAAHQHADPVQRLDPRCHLGVELDLGHRPSSLSPSPHASDESPRSRSEHRPPNGTSADSLSGMSGGRLPSRRLAATAEVRRLEADDVAMIARIDRSEHVDVEFAVVDGALTERPVTMVEIPHADLTGTGPHGVAAQIEFCRPLIAAGAVLLGVFADEHPRPRRGGAEVEPELAWLAWLHVDTGTPPTRCGSGAVDGSDRTRPAGRGSSRSMCRRRPPALPSASTSGRGVGWLIQRTRFSSPTSPTTSISSARWSSRRTGEASSGRPSVLGGPEG